MPGLTSETETGVALRHIQGYLTEHYAAGIAAPYGSAACVGLGLGSARFQIHRRGCLPERLSVSSLILPGMDEVVVPITMSPYEQKRWKELQAHWEKKAEGRKALLPLKARAALDTTVQATKDRASHVGKAMADRTPEKVKDAAGVAVGAALIPAMHNVVQVLELLNEWVVELTNPETVLRYHRENGREVGSLSDLRKLDLEHLEELTDSMALRWRTIGLGEGAILGWLAMIPVPVLGSAAAITLDLIAMQALTGAIATRVCYSYGYDANDPDIRHVIDRMVARAYKNQVVKANSVKNAAAAFDSTKLRVNWSQKLREDHRLMAAVEKLLKQVGDGKRVPVKNARMGMPVIAILAGAATNSHVLGDTVKQARHYGATVLLAEKHGLELPPNLRRELDTGETDKD